jgi:alpha-galactosidase
MKDLLISLILLTLTLHHAAGQTFSPDNNACIVRNGAIERVINLNKNGKGLSSTSIRILPSGTEFLNPGSEEFSFEWNDREYTGLDNWEFISATSFSDDFHGKGTRIKLHNDETDLTVQISYVVYPDLPVIRKKISFLNTGKLPGKIQNLDIERIHFKDSQTGVHCWVMNDYVRQKSLGQFIGNWYDPVVVVHQADKHRGIVLGNEAPGVMKRTTAFLQPQTLSTGLTHSDQLYPFAKYLNPGEEWESTWVFTGLYENSDNPNQVINGPVNDFIRKHIGTRITQLEKKPVFIYNTWEPFRHNINASLIYELADAAADCGFQEFIIDDGWQNSYGDWGIDSTKFPNGLKPVFDYIKSKGMKPGLWISLGAAEESSNVFKNHPEWLVRKADGSPINLQYNYDKMYAWQTYSMCMTTGWYDYIKNVILNLVKEHGLEYIKADFAVVTGAYTTDKTRSGCHATGHSMHHDRNESMLLMYQRTWQLFDDLHAEAPNLFIDCTFETMGAYQLIDLDMCKHADGNWLSNFGETSTRTPFQSLRIRQMAWWRSPVIPAAAMVIGNQHLDDPYFELSLMSLTGTLPIVLGDPRKLSEKQRADVNAWSSWLQRMQAKYDYMAFRQDLPTFGEPTPGHWDGFQRINTDLKNGGIVGVFRYKSIENERQVNLQFLNPDKTYNVIEARSGKLLQTSSGRKLMEEGFPVRLMGEVDGALFEIAEAAP